MKVVAFSGSARKDGNTAILVNHVFSESEKEGIQTELVQLAGKTIRGYPRIKPLIPSWPWPRLKRHKSELFTFLEYENVSPYNNHAEQQMRRPVLTRKISQQNRSERGSKTQALFYGIRELTERTWPFQSTP